MPPKNTAVDETASDTDELFDPYVGGETEEDTGEVVGSERGDFIETEEAEEIEETESKSETEEIEAESETEKAESETKEIPPAEAENKEDISVPKTRLDKEIQRRRALEERLQNLEQQGNVSTNPVVPNIESDELKIQSKALFESVLEGNLDNASETLTSMLNDVALRVTEQTQQNMSKEVSEKIQRNKNIMSLNEVIIELEDSYPQFNPNSELFNNELVQETLALHEGFKTQGLTPAQAMRRAAEYSRSMYNQSHTPADELQSNAPNPPANTKPTNIPPSLPAETLKGTDADKTKHNTKDLSDRELEALPESTKRRLRGDFL